MKDGNFVKTYGHIASHTEHNMINYFVRLQPLSLKLLVKLAPVFSEEILLSVLD